MGLMDFFKKGEERPVEKRAEANMPEKKVEEKKIYTIKSGDSLSKIAKNEYGDAQKWQIIFEANKDTIKDPNLIHPGQKIEIPNLNADRGAEEKPGDGLRSGLGNFNS